jgi:hypothetical protein
MPPSLHFVNPEAEEKGVGGEKCWGDGRFRLGSRAAGIGRDQTGIR